MSSLVNRIQAALLGSTMDEEYVRGLLRELQIPAGRTPTPDCVKQVRRVLLWSGASTEEMREAFANVGITGHDDEAALRAEVNKLLAAEDEPPTA